MLEFFRRPEVPDKDFKLQIIKPEKSLNSKLNQPPYRQPVEPPWEKLKQHLTSPKTKNKTKHKHKLKQKQKTKLNANQNQTKGKTKTKTKKYKNPKPSNLKQKKQKTT